LQTPLQVDPAGRSQQLWGSLPLINTAGGGPKHAAAAEQQQQWQYMLMGSGTAKKHHCAWLCAFVGCHLLLAAAQLLT
jgi:hypothetical protein